MRLRFTRWTAAGLLVAGLMPAAAIAQNGFDNSANATLAGTYFIRELTVSSVSATGSIGQAQSAFGTIRFSAEGGFTFNGEIMDSTSHSGVSSTAVTINGSFGVAANGFLQMQSLLSTTANKTPDTLRGGVGVVGPSAFVASATEGPNFDMIVGIPVTTGLQLSSYQGAYAFTYINFLEAQAGLARNAWFTMNSLGNGTAGFLGSLMGSAANLGDTTLTQYSSGVGYTLSDANGGSFMFNSGDAPSELISGTKSFELSADGNLVIGGDPGGYDLLVGARAVTADSNANISSFYYLAGLEANTSQLANGSDTIDCFYGSSSATTGGIAIDHQRTNTSNATPQQQDVTSNLGFTVAANGSFQPTGSQYEYSLAANNQVLVGSGYNSEHSLIVGLAQSYNQNTTVFLNPLGVVNAASYAPVTNPVAPLEIVLLFGENLTATPASASYPLPTTLGKTQVLINGQAAPLFWVSPALIVAQVPYQVGPAYGVSYATFQVVNNSVASNLVTTYVRGTAPGIFSVGESGLSGASAVHADGSLVSDADPAVWGETVTIYTTGLGAVSPGIGNGIAASPPARVADGKPVVLMDGIPSPTVSSYALATGLAGVYQIAATVPSGTTVGDVSLAVATADGSTTQTTISVRSPQ
jgi:uncharacterized protein (TIGR03437 family)